MTRSTVTRHSATAATWIALASWLGACAVIGEEGDPSLDQAEYAGGLDPVVFVHACPRPPNTEAAATQFFGPMKTFLSGKGYPSAYLNQFLHVGPVCESAIDQAAQLADFVDSVRAATGAPRVDVVAHSFGAFVTRLYLAQGGNRYVRDFVAIGGPNHGTFAAAQGLTWQDLYGYPAYEGVQEMYPPYACAGQTYMGSADVQAVMNGCLTPTGRTVWVDETPNGGVDYLSIRNTLGQEVQPLESACLNQRYQNDCSDTDVNKVVSVGPGPGPCGPAGCPADIAIMFNPGVIDTTYQFIAHPDDGDDIDDPDRDDDDDD